MDKAENSSCFRTALNHIKNDVRYPASKEEIMAACSGFSEISASEREWFSLNIPDRSFNGPDEVLLALFDKI
jgi:hypothetical protein